MTEQEITQLIANRVMGWELHSSDHGPAWRSADGSLMPADLFAPLHKPRDYMRVVRQVREQHSGSDEPLAFSLTIGHQVKTPLATAAFSRLGFHYNRHLNVRYEATARSVGRAICLAALRVIGAEKAETNEKWWDEEPTHALDYN